MNREQVLAYRIVWGMVFLLLPLATQATADEAESPAFKFVQICDTQLGFGVEGYDEDVQSFRQAVKQINAMKPAFVVICGDLVNKPEPQAFADFKEVTEEFEVPFHCAAGNHDVGNQATAESLAAYRKAIGKDIYSFQHKGCTYLVVNTVLWKAPIEKETAAQDEWLEKSLRQAKAESSPVVVVGHHPLFLKKSDEKEEYFNIPPEKRAGLLRLFVENGVVAVLTGHTHRVVENEHEGILLLSGETTSKNFDKRPFGFRVWEVDEEGKVSHRFVELEE